MMTFYRLITILGLVAAVLATTQAEDTKPETPVPPFPSIYKTSILDNNKIKIVSEIIDNDVGYQTTEEYADLKAGRAAFLVSSHDKGQEVVFSDTKSATIYKYRPYKCERFKLSEKVYNNLNDYSVHHEAHKLNDVLLDKRKTFYLRLFGVAAWWLSAENEPKLYSKSDLIFSTSKDIYRPSHNWEFQENGMSITFHFMEANYNSKANHRDADKEAPLELSLEMIQIKSLETKKILRTINVMMIDYWIEDDVFNKYLQLPVGYGCLASDEDQNADGQLDEGLSWYRFNLDHGRTELEITETRILDGEKKTRTTKTVNVELAHTKLNNFDLTLTRIKNNNEDIRTVYWTEFKTKFRIDMRKSTCEMSHFVEGEQNKLTVDEDRQIRFSNESGFSLDWQMLELLFTDLRGFKFVKQTENSLRDLSHMYFEKEITKWPYQLDGRTWSDKTGQDDQVARVIRNFVTSGNLEVLESVTIWLFDKSQTEITRSYHINLINYREVDPFQDVPHVFDVSEECYLNNNKYRSGKQYAWFELFYPTTSRINDLLGQDELRFKEMVYKQILSTPNIHLSSFRMPRMEFMFDDEGLIVRSLVLDRPSVELIYDQVERAMVVIDETKGDSFQVEPDVEHCAKVCHLHSCKAMSYCRYERGCYVRLERTTEAELTVGPTAGCTTYLLPKYEKMKVDDDVMVRELHDSSLQQILSNLRHQDYGVVPLPKAPDEVLMSQSESGLDDEAYQALMRDYTKELNRFLAEDAHLAPQLSLIIMSNANLFVLLPSKFTIEDDPLDQFNLIDREAEDVLDYGQGVSDDQGPSSGSYFRGGIADNHYKLTAFMKSSERAKQFNGLSYDQCALACLDSKCGSFSYCHNQAECTISSVNSTKVAHQEELIERSADCSVSFRDFLANFKLFDNVYAPQVYRRQSKDVMNPSDCALECVSSKDFRCLSFQFCKASKSCYYQDSRHPSGIYDTATTAAKKSNNSTQATPTGCDHYERSLLADFNQIEYREIEASQLAKLRTTTFEHKSVFQCADICANQLADCSAFQFCFLHKEAGELRPQQCQMIQSKPEQDNQQQQFGVIIDERNHDQVVEEGKFIVKSEQCHLFALRKDTSEAQLRELALPYAVTLQETEELAARAAGASRGLSLMGGLCLFVGIGLVSTVLGFSLSVAYERNDFVRQRVERARLLLGV